MTQDRIPLDAGSSRPAMEPSNRYCSCDNSKTNPCIICGKRKFIDPEWLKRKIETDPEEGEIGAGFEIPCQRLYDDILGSLMAQRTRQEERVRVLEEALWPFASYLDLAAFDLDNSGNPLPDDQGMGWTYLTVGDFRRARAALGNGGGDA